MLTRCMRARAAHARLFSARPAGRLDPSGYVKGWAVAGCGRLVAAASADLLHQRRRRHRRAAAAGMARSASAIPRNSSSSPPCSRSRTWRWPPPASTSRAPTSSTRTPAARRRACSRSRRRARTSRCRRLRDRGVRHGRGRPRVDRDARRLRRAVHHQRPPGPQDARVRPPSRLNRSSCSRRIADAYRCGEQHQRGRSHMNDHHRVEQLRVLITRLERMPASPKRDWMLSQVRARTVDVESGVRPEPIQPRTLDEPVPQPEPVSHTPAAPPAAPAEIHRTATEPPVVPAPVGAPRPAPRARTDAPITCSSRRACSAWATCRTRPRRDPPRGLAAVGSRPSRLTVEPAACSGSQLPSSSRAVGQLTYGTGPRAP